MANLDTTTHAQGNIIQFNTARQRQLPGSTRNIGAMIQREQLRLKTQSPGTISPTTALLEIADILEKNALFLERCGAHTRPSVDSLIDVTAYLRDWAE